MQDVTSECSGANAREGASDSRVPRPLHRSHSVLSSVLGGYAAEPLLDDTLDLRGACHEALVTDMPSCLMATEPCAIYQRYFSAWKECQLCKGVVYCAELVAGVAVPSRIRDQAQWSSETTDSWERGMQDVTSECSGASAPVFCLGRVCSRAVARWHAQH